MTTMTRDELLTAYKAGWREFGDVSLRGTDLTGANLCGAFLIEANLRGAFLAEANLAVAYLRGTDLTGADLHGVDFTDADLRGANLREAVLTGANLTGANLTGARLIDANLSGTNLRAADLRDAQMVGVKLDGAYLIGAHGLYGIYLPFMSSRQDALYAGVYEHGGKLKLLFDAGCKEQKTASQLRMLIRKAHGDSARAVQYEAAIVLIETCFASDLATGRFDVKIKAEAVS